VGRVVSHRDKRQGASKKPVRTRLRCAVTGKRCFKSEGAAGKVIAQIRKGPRRPGGTPCRAYKCEFCGHYHLTSREAWGE